MLTLRPLEDRVVVKPSEPEQKTSGGIFLPDSAQEKSTRGEIIAVGPGRLLKDGKRAKMSVKVGAKVLYSKYGGTEIKIEGNDYRIIGESEILAVL